jgi:hypothetical protein
VASDRTDGGPTANFVQKWVDQLAAEFRTARQLLKERTMITICRIYTNVIFSVVTNYMDYTPVGEVLINEDSAERAFAAADNDLRYHFNLPATLNTNSLLTVAFDALNLDDPTAVNTDRRYGIEVYFNGVLVQPQIVIRPAQLNTRYNTPTFTLPV